MMDDHDLIKLNKSINRPRQYKLAEVQDKIEKVAFDVVRFKDADRLDHLWRIESTDDGDVIVAMYEDDELKSEASVQSDWNVHPDAVGNVHFYYKKAPVLKVACTEIGLDPDDLMVIKGLPQKLASDKSMVQSLMLEVPLNRRFELFNQFPELHK